VARAHIQKGHGWELISTRYPKSTITRSYPAQKPNSPLHWPVDEERAIALNQYLTKGMDSRDEQYVAVLLTYLDSPHIYCMSAPEEEITMGPRSILKEILDKIVRLRVDQVFQDGNHIFLLYEMSANHKILLQAKPLTLCIMLSSRGWYSDHGKGSRRKVVNVMYRHCNSRLKVLDAVPSMEERPALFANAIKSFVY
jgi:hypothetical protein